jgi:hypothetical protein
MNVKFLSIILINFSLQRVICSFSFFRVTIGWGKSKKCKVHLRTGHAGPEEG